MCDKTRAAFALSNFFVTLRDRVDIHKVVIRSHRQMLSIRRVLQFMDDFFAVFYMSYFWKIPLKKKKNLPLLIIIM